jgi:hypothetical protein
MTDLKPECITGPTAADGLQLEIAPLRKNISFAILSKDGESRLASQTYALTAEEAEHIMSLLQDAVAKVRG